MLEKIKTELPAILSTITPSSVQSELSEAVSVISSAREMELEEEDPTWPEFRPVVQLLTDGPLCGWWSGVEKEVEDCLRFLIGTVGREAVRSAYLEKLLTENEKNFSEVVHEISIAGRACHFLEPNTFDLEKKLPNSPKDSDVFGVYKGRGVRIEATVFHGKTPQSVDLDWIEEIESANVKTGFIVVLRKSPSSMNDARDIKEIIERLSEQHCPNNEKDIEIGGRSYRWNQGSYGCLAQGSLIGSVQLDLPSEYRDVINPCSTQRVTPRSFEVDFPNPEEVSSFMPKGVDHDDVTTSKRILDVIERKCVQCDQTTINVIALGNPKPWHDSDIKDALYGAKILSNTFSKDPISGGLIFHENPSMTRNVKAPFHQARFMTEEDRITFVEPYRIVSGVWVFRREGDGVYSQFYVNPNASNPVPDCLVSQIKSETSVGQRWKQVNAYYQWLSEGKPENRSQVHWKEAESEFKSFWSRTEDCNSRQQR